MASSSGVGSYSNPLKKFKWVYSRICYYFH
jgi:hypothetical protein